MAADLDKTLKVTVTGKRSGYAPASRTSAKSAKIGVGKLTATPVPKITGTAKKGKTLTVTTGSWGPKGVKTSITWQRCSKYAKGKLSGCSTIKNAKSKTYKLAAADTGKYIAVKVTGKCTGFTTVTKTSSPTKKIAK